jgi:hypothetical protein
LDSFFWAWILCADVQCASRGALCTPLSLWAHVWDKWGCICVCL